MLFLAANHTAQKNPIHPASFLISMFKLEKGANEKHCEKTNIIERKSIKENQKNYRIEEELLQFNWQWNDKRSNIQTNGNIINH